MTTTEPGIAAILHFAMACISLTLASAGDHHHAAGGGTQALDVYSEGNSVHLLIGESRKEGEQPELLYLHSADGGNGWAAPVRVDTSLPAPHGVHRGMDPQIAASGQLLIAVWMTKGTGYADAGPLVTAVSRDGGKTWRQGPNPADDGATSGHGFIDLAHGGSEYFHLTWLDSRDGQQGLRYASSQDGGKSWGRNATVKAGTCECCWNSIAVGPGGEVAILFRDKGPRDMGLALSPDGGKTWPKPWPVGKFGWEFDGCPHVGGGVALDASSILHTVVWNGGAEKRGVFYLASKGKAGSWTEPYRLGGESASHPDLAVSPSGAIAAVWDTYTGAGTDIQGAVSTDRGATWTSPASFTDGKVSATTPRVIATNDGFRVFWTETRQGRPAAWRTRIMN